MKLITWNIQWGRGADGRVDLDRIVAHAQRFADFDVLCLQEVSAGHDQLSGCDGSDQFEQLAERLHAYEPFAAVATDTLGPAGNRRRFGNMLLSRLPVRQVFRHLLPWPVEEGVMSMQRVAIEATLDTPLGLLRVTTTHLGYYSPRQRAAQIAAVLCGDCNFKPEDPDRAQVLAAIDPATPALLDAWEIAHPGRPHEPTVGVYDKEQWPDPPFTFDFAFVSADIASRVRDVRVDATTDASDHQPVLVELA